MAADGSAARCRRTSVRCGSKNGTIPASCASRTASRFAGQPAVSPISNRQAVQGSNASQSARPAPSLAPQAPRLLFLSKFRSAEVRRFQPGPPSNPVKPSQSWSCHPAPRTPDPEPQTRKGVKPSQGRSRSVRPSQGCPCRPAPRPQTQTPNLRLDNEKCPAARKGWQFSILGLMMA